MKISYETRLKLHPLEIIKNKKNYIVKNQSTSEYFEMPQICIHAIEMLENGVSMSEIQKKLTSEYPDEEVNLVDFAGQLIEMELVQEVDGQKFDCRNIKERSNGFLWIPSSLGKIFFNKFSNIIYFLLFISNIGILIANPHFFPHYKDLFVFDVMVFNILFFMFITFILVLIHEFGHVFAMRAVGLSTKLEIGHRLFLVVLETDMSSVWGLPAKKRNILYLAGICFDNVMLFLALLVTLLFPSSSEVVVGIAGIIVFDAIIRMIYQSCFYMKTDMYYVFENTTGCYNLMENAQAYFKEKFFLKNKGKSSTEIFAGEKPVVITYGVFYLTGMAITLFLFAVYFIPQFMYMVNTLLHYIKFPFTTTHFWDAVVVLLQLFIGFGLLLYSWRKSYILQRGQR